MSRCGDIFVDSDNDNDRTDYFTPCACVRGNNSKRHDTDNTSSTQRTRVPDQVRSPAMMRVKKTLYMLWSIKHFL